MKNIILISVLSFLLFSSVSCSRAGQTQDITAPEPPSESHGSAQINSEADTGAYHDSVSFADTAGLSPWDDPAFGVEGDINIDIDNTVDTGIIAAETTAASAEPEPVFTAASSRQSEYSPSETDFSAQTVTAAAGTVTAASSVYQESPTVFTAVYLGVKDYGSSYAVRKNMNGFRYRFSVDGAERVYEIDNGDLISGSTYSYPIQNLLKENYPYSVTVTGNKITAVNELAPVSSEPFKYFSPPVSGTPGVRTVGNFLRTALEPVGTALYVFGGGWDWQDTGTAIQGKTVGVSPDWIRFFEEHDEYYTYRDKDGNGNYRDPAHSYYPYGGYNEYYYAGLDCSGYVGWVIYNTLNTESGKDGYVTGATKMAKQFAENGWGEWTRYISVPDGSAENLSKPGDIVSINGHIWISLGTCSDGSVVILHSTPSYSRAGQPGGGVQISAVGYSENCEAYRLADKYMSEYFGEWYRRYPAALKSPASYFKCAGEYAGRFRWSGSFLSDPDGITEMNAEDALRSLFGE